LTNKIKNKIGQIIQTINNKFFRDLAVNLKK